MLVAIALPLLFPDGRLPSRRWRWIAWAGVAGALIGTLSTLLTPGKIDSDGAQDASSTRSGAPGRAS